MMFFVCIDIIVFALCSGVLLYEAAPAFYLPRLHWGIHPVRTIISG